MKEVEKRRALNNNTRTKQRTTVKTEKKDVKLNNNGKALNGKEVQSKPIRAKSEPKNIVSDSNTGTESTEFFETVDIQYADDVNKPDETGQDSKEGTYDSSSELDRESKQGKEEEVSDSETAKDSLSSHGDSIVTEDEKVEEKLIMGKSPENKSCESKEDTSDSGNEKERNGNEAVLGKKIEEMEARIEKLEEELREVAALEISLYSVVPEHGSSAHKVHTPARRLSRIYLHACKYWTQDKRASVARNTVSGLLLVAKSCGNDVPRLTFWLSNTVVLREIVSHAFGGSRLQSPLSQLAESNGDGKRGEAKSATLKWKVGFGGKQIDSFGRFSDDWQETGTFTAALEKVESWIFSRVVESVWWQALTPHMQSPCEGISNNTNIGKMLGPSLGNQNQGNFSINLWKIAFQDAAQRLCPVRAGGHECGCLPVLARMVMEQCIARLDVAMFNAILRESVHEIPTDPVSDPIVDSKVLPIPAGDLSFGSGAQLKNSIGNWSRWLTDMFGMDADDVPGDDKIDCEDDDESHGGDGNAKSFYLLNSLSDLLMLPKDMLMERSIRKEVCPSISLALIKRILCNFTPDEFCPDPVPGTVLEALNAESIAEQRKSGDSMRSFPYTVASVVYGPPSHADVAEKCLVSDKSELVRNASVVQRKGYTSDDELDELQSPLTYIVDKSQSSSSSSNIVSNGNGNHNEIVSFSGANERYDLLSEVWSV